MDSVFRVFTNLKEKSIGMVGLIAGPLWRWPFLTIFDNPRGVVPLSVSAVLKVGDIVEQDTSHYRPSTTSKVWYNSFS